MYDLCKEDLRINFHTMRTGIFYGSTTGMTESLAAKIAARMEKWIAAVGF